MKKKLTGKSGVSKPKDAKPMKPEEQGGVLSMKQLIEIYENTAKTVGGKDRPDLGEDTVDALSGLALKTEEKAGFIEQIAEAVTGGAMGTGGGGGEKETMPPTEGPEGGGESEEDILGAVGNMFDEV